MFPFIKIQDSLSHLQGSLEDLVKILRQSNHDWPLLRQSRLLKDKYGNLDQDKFRVCLQKCIFPYEFATSVSILKATLQIPPKECFASKLTGQKTISDAEFEYCCTVFRLFSCANMYDYLQVYNHIGMYKSNFNKILLHLRFTHIFLTFSDSLLLAEVFIAYEKKLFGMFKIWPSAFLTLPSYRQIILRSIVFFLRVHIHFFTTFSTCF